MQYDLIVIGAGPGGYVAAIRAAQLGLKTAVAERAEVGGTCLNRGCIPTKTLMHSANLYREIGEAGKMGVNINGAEADFKAMHARKAQVVEQLRGGVAQLLKGNGIDVLEGEAAFVSPESITVGGETYTAKNFIIATGSKPAVPPIPGADLPNVVTSDEMLDTDSCDYNELVIIGGGVIGVEMAGVYNGIGRKVTIIEALDRILANMDREISQNLSMILKKRGVAVNTGAMVTGITQEGGRLTCTFERKGKTESVSADGVLICVGRRAVTEGLNLEAAGVETERGRVKVGEAIKPMCHIFTPSVTLPAAFSWRTQPKRRALPAWKASAGLRRRLTQTLCLRAYILRQKLPRLALRQTKPKPRGAPLLPASTL